MGGGLGWRTRREVDVVLGTQHGGVAQEAIALGDAPMDPNEGEAGREALHLVGPVLQHRERCHHQVGARQLVLLERGKEGERLDRLAEPHLVAKDPAGAEGVLLEQPVDAVDLVGAQLRLQERLARADAHRLVRRHCARLQLRELGGLDKRAQLRRLAPVEGHLP